MKERDTLSVGCVLSLLLHGLLLCLILFGDSFWSSPPPPAPALFTVDIVNVGPRTRAPAPPKAAVSQAPPKNVTPKTAVESPPAPPKPEVFSPSPEPAVPVEPVLKKLPEKKPKPAPKKEPKPLPTPQEKKKRPVAEKKPSKAPAKASQAKSSKPSATKKKKSQGLGALLSQVEGTTGATQALDSLLEASENSSGAVGAELGEPTITEVDLIRQQIQKYWHPSEAIEGTGVRVVVEIHLGMDGKVQDFKVLPERGTPHHAKYQLALESVQRALRDPDFHFPLPPARYEVWKTITPTFEK